MQVDLFALGDWRGQDSNWADERTVNLYPEIAPQPGAKPKVVLMGRPGLSLFATVGDGPIRGMWANDYRLFVVSGSRLYEVWQGGASSDLGNVGNDGYNSPVCIIPNGRQLLVVSAGNVYVHTGTQMIQPVLSELSGRADVPDTLVSWVSGDTFDPQMVGATIYFNLGPGNENVARTVTWVHEAGKHLRIDSGLGGQYLNVEWRCTPSLQASSADFCQGYYVVARKDSKQFNLSGLYDGLSWDPLDYAFKEFYPDNIVRVLSHDGELWLIGTDTTEVWKHTGDADFPFARTGFGAIDLGCIAPWSVVRTSAGPMWIGGDRRGRVAAWLVSGYRPQRVSTSAMEKIWMAYGDGYLRRATAFSYWYSGHEFVQITFESENGANGYTWVYDISTSVWHEQITNSGAHLGRFHAFVWNRHLVGSRSSGKIYEMSANAYTDDGSSITRSRRCRVGYSEDKRVFYHQFQLDVHTGIIASNPEYKLRWSDDDGHTFVPFRTAYGGMLGEYGRRVLWRRLGSGRDRIFEVSSDAPIPHCWVGATVELTGGNS